MGQRIVTIGQSRSGDDSLHTNSMLATEAFLEESEHFDFQIASRGPFDVTSLGGKARILAVLIGCQKALPKTGAGSNTGFWSRWIEFLEGVGGKLDDLTRSEGQTTVSLGYKIVNDLASLDGFNVSIALGPAVIPICCNCVPANFNIVQVGHDYLVVLDGASNRQTGNNFR